MIGKYKYEKKFYIYSHSSVPWQQRILTDFLKSIPIKNDLRCLDVGCGIGNNLSTLSIFFDNITACDISNKALDYAKKRQKNKKINFIHTDIENLPFQDHCFDIIICTEVLEHVNNITKARNELIRVLKKKNGYFIISTPNYFNLAGIVKFLIDKISRKKTWDVWGDTKGLKENFTTSFGLKKLFKKNIAIIDECGGDFLNSWLLFLPFIFRNFKFTDKHPILWLGRLKFFRRIAMNYFLLGKTNLHQ